MVRRLTARALKLVEETVCVNVSGWCEAIREAAFADHVAKSHTLRQTSQYANWAASRIARGTSDGTLGADTLRFYQLKQPDPSQ